MLRQLCVALGAAAVVGLAPVARADVITTVTTLSGAIEVPPNSSLGTGTAEVDLNTSTHMLHVHVDFSGLTGTTTASHVHSATAVPRVGTAIVATTTPTFTGFPLGVTSGTYDHTFDTTLASSWNGAFITAHGGTPLGAEAFFAQSLLDGTAYLNVHTSFAPGGEIRGFLQAVPEPGSMTLLGLGAAGLFALARRRLRAA